MRISGRIKAAATPEATNILTELLKLMEAPNFF
jgi:hypothetical protein